MIKVLLISLVMLSGLCIEVFQIANAAPEAGFTVIPLGTSGGELQDNLSAYLVSPIHSNNFVALDAGTLCSSIKKLTATQLQKIGIKNSANHSAQEVFFTGHIKAYLLSHAHLDHIAGLVICSTADTKKVIMGTDTTLNYLRDNIFNWKIWPNFADEGSGPLLKIYHYQRLGFHSFNVIPQTGMRVRAFPLSHGNGYPSTAFLLESKGFYLLYLGDTGADAIEKSDDLSQLWRVVAPIIRAHKLLGIFMESSYTNARPDNQLFGHLTPNWLLSELNQLALLVSPQQPQQALKGLNIIVTHVKQGMESANQTELITRELNAKNNLGVYFIFPKQGQEFKLSN